MTEAEASEKRQKEFAERSKMFEEELDVDETLSQLSWPKASASWKKSPISTSPNSPRSKGFDEELGQELQSRAVEALSAARKRNARSGGVWA